MSHPNWLPDPFSVSPWTESTYDELYKIFRRDFIESQPVYLGHTVWCFPEIEDGKEKIFWHLTSQDDTENGERLPDLRRCERLPWAKPMLENPKDPEMLAWDHSEGDGSVRTYVWLINYSFVVIMKKYPDEKRRMVTSFYVEHPHYSRKLMKKYNRRL